MGFFIRFCSACPQVSVDRSVYGLACLGYSALVRCAPLRVMTRKTLRLSHGRHTSRPGACVMEVVSLLFHRRVIVNGNVEPDWEWSGKTDAPRCTSVAVAVATQRVHDRTPDDELGRLAPLLPRLLR